MLLLLLCVLAGNRACLWTRVWVPSPLPGYSLKLVETVIFGGASLKPHVGDFLFAVLVGDL
jgi:hypothetical protein